MNMEKLYDTYYNKVDNLILNGRESSYMYMGVLEHHIPEIGLKRKDEERPNYYVTDTYFNRHLDEYKQSKERIVLNLFLLRVKLFSIYFIIVKSYIQL